MKDDRVYIKLNPKDVNYVNRILEGYEYLGVLTTIDKKLGTCIVNSTADTRDEVIYILTNLDCPVTILPAGMGVKKEAL